METWWVEGGWQLFKKSFNYEIFSIQFVNRYCNSFLKFCIIGMLKLLQASGSKLALGKIPDF